MKHYFARCRTRSRGGLGHEYQIIDTLDLANEVANLYNCRPFYTEKFINAFYCDYDVTERYNNNESVNIFDMIPRDPLEYKHTPFEFEIKDGFISYDGEIIRIRFKGSDHVIMTATMREYWKYIIYDELLVGSFNHAPINSTSRDVRIDDVTNDGGFYVEDINTNASNTTLIVKFGIFNSSLSLVLDFNYKIGMVSFRAVRSSADLKVKSLNDFLRELIKNMEPELKRTGSGFVKDPLEHTDLFRKMYEMDCVDKKLLTKIMDLYIHCCATKRVTLSQLEGVFADYDKYIGFPENPETLIAKKLFYRGKDKK